MTAPSPDPRLLELVQRWSDDAISDPEVRELEVLLRRDPEGPRLFAELTHLDQSLRALGPGTGKEEAGLVAPPRQTQRFTAAEILALAALAVLAIAVAGVLFPARPGSREKGPPAQPAAQFSGAAVLRPSTSATLTHSIGARWAPPSAPLREGEDLPAGPLRLQAGLAHIQFMSGMRLVLEGPAVLESHSLNSAFCRAGRFYAAIPRHAGAFALATPRGVVTDTGAEFGIQIDPGGATGIHVFRGRLAFRTPDLGDLVPLSEGQAAEVGGPEGTKLFAADTSRFVTDTQFMERHTLQRERAFNAWRLASLDWRRDPRLLALFDFDAADPLRGIIPVVGNGSNSKENLEAILIRPQRAEGRWPGKLGFAFTEPSQRIRIQISGHQDALTLTMWVRPATLPDRPCSLLVSDGFDFGAAHRRRLGAVHWTIHGRTSQLTLQTRRHPGEEALYSSSLAPFAPLQTGRWTHLACVYDRLQNRVRHFIHGEPAGVNPLQVNVRLEIGVAEIGNCPDPACPSSFFPGIIDEVSVFQASLTDEEIRSLCRLGKPE